LGRDGGDLPFYNAQKEHDSQHDNNKDTTDEEQQEHQHHWWNGVAKHFTTTNKNSNTEKSEAETPYSSLVVNKEGNRTSPSKQTTTPFQEPLTTHPYKRAEITFDTRRFFINNKNIFNTLFECSLRNSQSFFQRRRYFTRIFILLSRRG